MRLLSLLFLPLVLLLRVFTPSPPRPRARSVAAARLAALTAVPCASWSAPRSVPARVLLPGGASRTRPYAPTPRIPDYIGFCEVALRHEARWEVTYDGGELPYRGRHRVHDDLMIACADLVLLDHALTRSDPPACPRPYADLARDGAGLPHLRAANTDSPEATA
ncbi:hypothetical protein HNR23_004081 [Nocardiopsis mwathae]|uniref:Uncharacterized protein n=1 Tax=Nocardiopsis mwathae TaxID=1472723 RepID=A0A7X0D7R7_9ACTN|nr:hypothetical protein [Nocardiopsis mwathae]MBB6174021.1 hypothetical protein [Nocardiopsis mwathae]